MTMLFLLSMILQIASRLLTICIFGMSVFPEHPLSPLILTGLVLGHIFSVFLLRKIICYKYYSAKLIGWRGFLDGILCAFGSVYCYVKIDFLQEKRAYQQDYQMRNVVQEKFWQRFAFNILILSEQIVMYVLIYINRSKMIIESSNRCVEFDIEFFILITGVIFVLGHLIEMSQHIFLNPFAKYRPRYNIRKLILYFSIACLSIVCISFLTKDLYVHYKKKDEYKNLFIPFITTMVVFALTVFTLNVDYLSNMIYDCLPYATRCNRHRDTYLNTLEIDRNSELIVSDVTDVPSNYINDVKM